MSEHPNLFTQRTPEDLRENSGKSFRSSFGPYSPSPELRSRTSLRGTPEKSGHDDNKGLKPVASLPQQYHSVMQELSQARFRFEDAKKAVREHDDALLEATGNITDALGRASEPRQPGDHERIMAAYDQRFRVTVASGPSKKSVRDWKAVVEALEHEARQINEQIGVVK